MSELVKISLKFSENFRWIRINFRKLSGRNFRKFLNSDPSLCMMHRRIVITRNILDCHQSNYSSFIIFSCIPPKLLCNSWKWIGSPVAEIWPFEVFQNARSVGRSLVLNIYIVLIHSSTQERSARAVKMNVYDKFQSLLRVILT